MAGDEVWVDGVVGEGRANAWLGLGSGLGLGLGLGLGSGLGSGLGLGCAHGECTPLPQTHSYFPSPLTTDHY